MTFVTKFLAVGEYHEYGRWLHEQDQDTKQMYFGFSVNPEYIDNLMAKINHAPDEHNFLVAQEPNGQWVGTVHMATIDSESIEFGIIVNKQYRGQGVADQIIDEAITWARNRRYQHLYMHCVRWNEPVRRLCSKHGLKVKNVGGDNEVDIDLPPPSIFSLSKEINIRNRNVFFLMLTDPLRKFRELYG